MIKTVANGNGKNLKGDMINMAEHLPKHLHLMKTAFKNFNEFKRFQTKELMARESNNESQSTFYELKKYQAQNKLELSMRGLQRELHNMDENDDDLEEADE